MVKDFSEPGLVRRRQLGLGDGLGCQDESWHSADLVRGKDFEAILDCGGTRLQVLLSADDGAEQRQDGASGAIPIRVRLSGHVDFGYAPVYPSSPRGTQISLRAPLERMQLALGYSAIRDVSGECEANTSRPVHVRFAVSERPS